MNFTYEVKLGKRKYSSRGISSLAKFTSANGNVYGTLALDTRRATQALPSSLLLMGMYMERWLLIPGEPLMMTLRNCQ